MAEHPKIQVMSPNPLTGSGSGAATAEDMMQDVSSSSMGPPQTVVPSPTEMPTQQGVTSVELPTVEPPVKQQLRREIAELNITVEETRSYANFAAEKFFETSAQDSKELLKSINDKPVT